MSRLGQILGAPALVKLVCSATHRTRIDSPQSSFRVDVIARDSICLVTDVPHQKCTAAHIVPYSRPDVSDRLPLTDKPGDRGRILTSTGLHASPQHSL